MYKIVCSCKLVYGLPENYVVVTDAGAVAKKMFVCPECVKRNAVGAKLKLELNPGSLLDRTDTSVAPERMGGDRAETFTAWNNIGGSLLK